MNFRLTIILVLLTGSVNAETITLTPSDDASVRHGVNNVNKNAKWLDVFDSSSIPRHTFIKFDIDAHTDDIVGGDIESATLRVYIQSVPRAGKVIFSILSVSWDEDSITGNNYPDSYSEYYYEIVDVEKSDRGGYYELDITDVAQDWFDGNGNYGIAINPASGDNARVRYASQAVSAKTPQVVIETTDSVQIAFEPFGKNIAGPTMKSWDVSNSPLSNFHRFQTLAKTTFSTLLVHFIDANFLGYCGVAIYSDNNGTPGDLLASHIRGVESFVLDLEELEFEFDSPVTLRPSEKYWFVLSVSWSSGGWKMGEHTVVSGDMHAGSGVLDISVTGFPDDPYVHSNDAVMWFRLIP